MRPALFAGLILALCSAATCTPGPPTSTASPSSRNAADYVFFGGVIETLQKDSAKPAFLAIRDGRILALGDTGDRSDYGGPRTGEIDLAGRALIPAFVDHHVHLLNVGLSLLNSELDGALFLDLSGLDSLEEIGRRVREQAKTQAPGSWILGKGWSQGAWGAVQLPVHDVLSEAAPENPVFLTRVDGHAGWVNRAAMALAGITRRTPEVAGGKILRRPGGEPAGVLLERANELILPHLPLPSDDQIRRAFQLGAEALAAQGIARIYDAGFLIPPGIVGLNTDLEPILEILMDLARTNPLPLDINLMIPAPTRLSKIILAEPQRYLDLTPRLRVTHLKLFADGAMGSRGAFLSRPFADDPATRGVARMSEEELLVQAEQALDAGLDVATHAIGDEALKRALNVYERLLQNRPDLKPGRLRIEHFSYAAESDFERAARLQIVLSIQPNFVIPDDHGLTMEDARVGQERSQRVYAWKRLADLGAPLAGGSDYFTAPGRPLLNFFSALTRRNSSGYPDQGWHPGQKLSGVEALKLLTAFYPPGGGPPSSGLGVGQSADLTLLSASPLQVPDSDLLEIAVEKTFLAGQPTFGDVKEKETESALKGDGLQNRGARSEKAVETRVGKP